MHVRGWMLVACVLVGCRGQVPIAADSLDEQQQKVAADHLDGEFDRAGLRYVDPTLDAYLNGVMAPLAAGATTPIRVHVARDPSLNAFAFPNGSVWITVGMLGQVGDETQLAWVLAHEEAHLERRHAIEALRDRQRTKVVSQLAGLVVAPIALADAASNGVYGAVVAGYSRDREGQADQDAAGRLVANGYSLAPVVPLFDALDAVAEAGNKGVYADHPSMAVRKAAVVALVAAHGADEGTRVRDASAFRDATRAVKHESARLCVESGRAPRGLVEADRLLTTEPNDAALYVIRGDAILATAHGDAGRASEAHDAFARAIALDPGIPEGHRGLGYVAALQNDKPAARRHLERYLELKPNAPDRRFVNALLAKDLAS